MRVLFILENYHPHIGGVETVFRHLTNGLAKKGHTVTVLTRRLPGTKRTEILDGVRIRRVCRGSRYQFSYSPVTWWRAWQEARQSDIVHTTTFNAALPARIAAWCASKPLIITVHETWIGKWKEYTDFSDTKAQLHEWLERGIFGLSYDRYVCVSDATAKRLLTVKPEEKEKIITIHNGFDPTHWKISRTAQAKQLRKKFGLEKQFVVFAYGRPGASKGFEYLISAFPMMRKKIPNATLVLMLSTDTQYAHKIARFKRNAHPDTLFVPPQRYDDLPAYLQMADCIVVPSLTEGFGYAVLEAAAAGVPVVASNTTSIPEVISGKHVLVRPGNPQSIARGVLRVHAKKYRTTREKRFPWSTTITAYERIYEDLA